MPAPKATGVPGKDVEMTGRREDAGFSSPPLFHHNHLLRKPAPVDHQLVDVHARCRLAVRVDHVAVPIRGKRAPTRDGSARQLAIGQLLTGSLKNRNRDDLREHVVNGERNLRPVTVGKEIAAQDERDRGRRIERIRIILFELYERSGRRLPPYAIHPPPGEAPPPPPPPHPPTPNTPPPTPPHLTNTHRPTA